MKGFLRSANRTVILAFLLYWCVLRTEGNLAQVVKIDSPPWLIHYIQKHYGVGITVTRWAATGTTAFVSARD